MRPWRLAPVGAAIGLVLALCIAVATAWGAAAGPDEGGAFLQTKDGNAGGAGTAAEDEEEPQEEADAGPSVFVPPDRATLRLLAKAQQLIEQGRHAEAVRCLGAILESSEDYFYIPDKASPEPRSLKSEAQRLLGQMSRRGRELYELQYGARARQTLAEAAAAGDAIGLAEVSRRFFHTRAGYEATLLLGLHHLDRGRPLAGAIVLQRLSEASGAGDSFEPTLSLALATCWARAGMAEEARLALAALKQRYPVGTVEIAGREASLAAEEAELLAELAGSQTPVGLEQAGQWLMFRGNAARNASTAGGAPLLSMRWRVPASDHPYVEAFIDGVRQANRDQDRAALPGLHPLVVDDVVLMRTARNLLAVDLVTGKRIWEVPIDDPYEALLQPPPNMPFRQTPQLELALRLRLWGDATYGTMSSDGEQVFAVEDLGLEVGPVRVQRVFIAGRPQTGSAGPRTFNRLAAYDIRTGKLKWHIGGSPEEFGLPQAGTFFLGPPLPLMGQLYVLAEVEGLVRLMALDAKTGTLRWSQQLASVDREILADPLRRVAGVSPSYADGVLVCPTSNKSVVALELATRSLLWGYSYLQQGEQQRQVMVFAVRSVLNPDPTKRWVDSSVVLADGRVLVTPVDSDQIHCLNLLDGKLVWKQPCQDDLYLACVHQGKVVLVGQRQVRALALDDGLPAWDDRTVEFPSGSVPSGSGFLNGDRYHVPLSTAQVMAIDLNTGRPAHLAKSRRGHVPGNLVCYQDKVISQRANGVAAFYQLDALREQVDQRLAAKADDPEALALRGEILWDEGKLEEAIAWLRRSLELDSDPNTRDLLRDAFFEGLREHFAAHRNRVDEIEPLIDEPQQRATFLRLMATGLETGSEFRAALEHYLLLIELDREHRDMEPVGESLLVRRDRWIQGHLAAMHRGAPSEVKSQIDETVRARLKEAVGEDGPEALEQFIEYFGCHAIADEARRELVRRHREAGHLLRAELLLSGREQSDDRQDAGGAVAELATILRQAERWEDAAACYARLDQEFADVACLEGKTGRELVAALPADDPVKRRLQPLPPWPVGKVETNKQVVTKAPPSTYTIAVLPYEGRRTPFFSDLVVELHQNPPMLVGRDALGNRQWELSLAELSGQGPFVVNRGPARVAVQGHMLLVSMPQNILAIDTLGASDNGSPRLLWSQDLALSGKVAASQQKVQVRVANVGGILQAFQLARLGNIPNNMPMAVSEQLICFKRFRNCMAIDPWTGETLWVRKDIRPESSLFGDREYVFVVPPGQPTAKVLRASDGELLGEREVPPQRMATFGRHVLVWQNTGTEALLELIDPWDNSKLWPARKFAANAVMTMVGHEAVAVLEREGRFVLVGLPDGRTIVDTKLQADPALSQIFVLPSPDQYLLVTHSSVPTNNVKRRVYPMHGLLSVRIVKGTLYAFDRQGNTLWPAPVAVENHYLPMNQPSGLPVVTFTCMVHEQQPNGRTQSKTSVLCIDRRTGRICLNEELPMSTNSFRLVGDPEKKTVEVQLQRETFTMTFTDKPLASDSGTEGASEGESSEGGKTSGTTHAILGALEKGVLGSPRKSPESTDGKPQAATPPQAAPPQPDGKEARGPAALRPQVRVVPRAARDH